MDCRPVPSREEILAALEKKQGSVATAKLQAATVAICGLGGLGSNIAISLARSGIGKLILIDFDTVDITNLHRQQYKASQVGLPKAEALLENLKLILSLFSSQCFTDTLFAKFNFQRLEFNFLAQHVILTVVAYVFLLSLIFFY